MAIRCIMNKMVCCGTWNCTNASDVAGSQFPHDRFNMDALGNTEIGIR